MVGFCDSGLCTVDDENTAIFALVSWPWGVGEAERYARRVCIYANYIARLKNKTRAVFLQRSRVLGV